MGKFYDLPPPWNPGYAIPGNVADEGLERHAFVTGMTARGTYDNPSVGSSGYAIPGYVRDEAYGQNAMGTRWAPRGSYAGPPVPHWLNQHPKAPIVKLGGLGGTDVQPAQIPAAYRAYGNRAATAIVKAIHAVTPAHRTAALKRALDHIDPTLYNHVDSLTKNYIRAGVPSTQALHAGISHAMSHGILKDMVKTGRGARVRKNSHLGLVALGASPSTTLIPSTSRTPGYAAGLPGQHRTCAPPAGFTWVAATPSAPNGHWEILRVGQTPAPAPVNPDGSCGTVKVVVHPSTVKAGQIMMVGSVRFAAMDVANRKTSTTQVIACDTSKVRTIGAIYKGEMLPQEFQDHVCEILARDCHPCVVTSMEDATDGHLMGNLKAFFPNCPARVNKDFVGINKDADNPVTITVNPLTGESYGIYMQLRAEDPSKPTGCPSNAVSLLLTFKKNPNCGDFLTVSNIAEVAGLTLATGGIVGLVDLVRLAACDIWKYIRIVVVAIVDAVEAAVNYVGDLACQLVNSAAGQVGAVAGGAAIGAAEGGPKGAQVGATAGAVGVQVGKALCNGQPITCPPGQYSADGKTCVPIQESSNLLPILLIGGVGLAAIVMINKKHKKKATP